MNNELYDKNHVDVKTQECIGNPFIKAIYQLSYFFSAYGIVFMVIGILTMTGIATPFPQFLNLFLTAWQLPPTHITNELFHGLCALSFGLFWFLVMKYMRVRFHRQKARD